MSTITDIKDIPRRYKTYINKFKKLFKEYDIKNISDVIKFYLNDDSFQTKSRGILIEVSKSEGGKLSLATIGIIIGTALGGAGIAMAGGAIGVSLAAVFGVGGFLSGSKIDSLGVLNSMRQVEAKIPDETYNRLKYTAEKNKLTIDEYLAVIIEHSVWLQED